MRLVWDLRWVLLGFALLSGVPVNDFRLLVLFYWHWAGLVVRTKHV